MLVERLPICVDWKKDLSQSSGYGVAFGIASAAIRSLGGHIQRRGIPVSSV
jgi:hypothetical protein